MIAYYSFTCRGGKMVPCDAALEWKAYVIKINPETVSLN